MGINIEDIFFVTNFYTEDIADYIIKEDMPEESDELIPDDKMVYSFLKNQGLSIDQLNGSIAIIQNLDKTLLVYFKANHETYDTTLLEFIEFNEFLKIVHYFNEPREVILREVSVQIGGIIDVNYGVKYRIELTSRNAESLEKVLEKKESISLHHQANIYLRAMLKIDINEEEYSPDINFVIRQMDSFLEESLIQIKYHEYNLSSNGFEILHRKGSNFYFGIYGEKGYAVVNVENHYLIYDYQDGEVKVLCETDTVRNSHLAIKKYYEGIEFAL